MEPILEELEPEKTFFVDTTETKFIFHLYKGFFYVRKLASKDPRYCLITSLDGKTKYKVTDLDLNTEIEYMHPRLLRPVNAGQVTSIKIR